MRRPKLTSDVKPVSEFRANAAQMIEHVRQTGRPLVLTQRGHSAAVVLDVEEYEDLVEEVELLRDIHLAERQIRGGKGIPHRAAEEQVRNRTKR